MQLQALKQHKQKENRKQWTAIVEDDHNASTVNPRNNICSQICCHYNFAVVKNP